MTPKQEREWAKGILEQLDKNAYEISLQFFAECRGVVRDFAKEDKLADKSYARSLADTFEGCIWLCEYQKGKITKDEFWKRIEDKAKAKAAKRVDAFNKRLDRITNPPKKKRIRRKVSGR